MARTFNDHEVFDKESILDVPTRLQHARRWIEQVAQLLVVDLQEARLHVELLLPHSHRLPHVAHRLSEKAVVLVGPRLPIILSNLRLVAADRVCFSRASLSVSKDCGRVAVQG